MSASTCFVTMAPTIALRCSSCFTLAECCSVSLNHSGPPIQHFLPEPEILYHLTRQPVVFDLGPYHALHVLNHRVGHLDCELLQDLESEKGIVDSIIGRQLIQVKIFGYEPQLSLSIPMGDRIPVLYPLYNIGLSYLGPTNYLKHLLQQLFCAAGKVQHPGYIVGA